MSCFCPCCMCMCICVLYVCFTPLWEAGATAGRMALCWGVYVPCWFLPRWRCLCSAGAGARVRRVRFCPQDFALTWPCSSGPQGRVLGSALGLSPPVRHLRLALISGVNWQSYQHQHKVNHKQISLTTYYLKSCKHNTVDKFSAWASVRKQQAIWTKERQLEENFFISAL